MWVTASRHRLLYVTTHLGASASDLCLTVIRGPEGVDQDASEGETSTPTGCEHKIGQDSTFNGKSIQPMAIVGEEKGTKARYFYLVMCLGKHEDGVLVQWLKEGVDGLFRPADSTWNEDESALVKIRTQWVKPNGNTVGGFRLLTLRHRILETALR